MCYGGMRSLSTLLLQEGGMGEKKRVKLILCQHCLRKQCEWSHPYVLPDPTLIGTNVSERFKNE